jgi:hypothetical protein
MTTHKGKPSGKARRDKKEIGIPADFKPSDIKRDKDIEDKYVKDDDHLSENVRTQHPNRNPRKTNATNAGGYRN